MSRGVLYLASGSSYIEEAISSAESLKRHNPSIPITLYTDGRVSSDVFSQVISLDDPINEMGDSILSQEHFPYNENLYLDVDTHICGDISGIFELLNAYELAVAPNASGFQWNSDIYNHNDIELPSAFPEFNTGVIAYTESDNVAQLFKKWGNEYETQNQDMVHYKTNQPSFRTALYRANVNHTTLLPEYNFQINRHSYARSKIKILHNTGDTGVSLREYAGIVNSEEEPRAVTLDDYPCRIVPISSTGNKYKIKNNIRNIKEHLYNSRSRKELIKRVQKKKENDGVLSLFKSILDQII